MSSPQAAGTAGSPTQHTPNQGEIVKAAPAAQAALPAMMPLGDMVLYAQQLAAADMLPKQFRAKPANVLYAMEYGRTLGITPLAAINGIHVIEGKPTASAALISGLVRRAGHKLRVRMEGETAVAEIVRSDDPEYTFRAEWTFERAQKAGLTSKDVWIKYRAAMLKARAITEVARDACEEVLFGLHYTPEELGAVVDQDGNPIEGGQQLVPQSGTSMLDLYVGKMRAAWPAGGDLWSVRLEIEQAGMLDRLVPVKGGEATFRDLIDARLAALTQPQQQEPTSEQQDQGPSQEVVDDLVGQLQRSYDNADALRQVREAASRASALESQTEDVFGNPVTIAQYIDTRLTELGQDTAPVIPAQQGAA